MRLALAVAFVVAALAGAAAAQASTIVYVCGKDLCRTDQTGKPSVRLTRDGGAGAYSRPTISRDGKRIAFKRFDRGRAFTARLRKRSLTDVTRIGPAPDGPRDATQFDVAIAPDGKRVAWVEQRINVVSRTTIDYRRYLANADGSSTKQVASSNGRPFVAFYDATRTLREGLTEPVDAMQEGESVDSGICVPSPATLTNGTCRGAGGALQVAFDIAGRHLRHPAMSPSGDRLVATAYATTENIDNAIERPGQIALFDARTTKLVSNLTTGTGDSGPVFSPDGKRVAFTRGSAIWTVPATGGTAKRLIARGTQPAWGR